MQVITQYQKNQVKQHSFKSGKVRLYTDFDHTLLPMNIDEFQSLPEEKRTEVRKYFSDINRFVKKCRGDFRITVTTGRNIDEFQDVINYSRKQKIPTTCPDVLITENGSHKYKRRFLDKLFPKLVKKSYKKALFQNVCKRQNTSDKKFDVMKSALKAFHSRDFVIAAGDGTNDIKMLHPYSYLEEYMKRDVSMNRVQKFLYGNVDDNLVHKLTSQWNINNVAKSDIRAKVLSEHSLETFFLNQLPFVSIPISRDKYKGRFDDLVELFGKEPCKKVVQVNEGDLLQGIKQSIEIFSKYKAEHACDFKERLDFYYDIKLSKHVLRAAKKILKLNI